MLGTLLIVAAALFAIGVATEGDAHDETVASVEAGEHDQATEAAEHNERAEGSETGEELLGVNLESTPLVVLAVTISVLLAAATWRTDHKLILLMTSLFAAAFAALDVAEFSHQIRESATTIAALAVTIALLHAAAALRRAASRRDIVTERQALVRRLVDEVTATTSRPRAAPLASAAPKLRTGFAQFRDAFPDWHQELTGLVAEDDERYASRGLLLPLRRRPQSGMWYRRCVDSDASTGRRRRTPPSVNSAH